jgi:hypothetical protein
MAITNMQSRGPGNTGHTGHRTKTNIKNDEQHGLHQKRGWTQVLEGYVVPASYEAPVMLFVY